MPYVHSRILALQRTNPAAVELAEAVSFAVQIEPALLRAARRHLVPQADAGAEADVWLSSLIEARGSDGVVLDRKVALLLRRELRQRRPDRFERAWALIRHQHRNAPAAIQLEEEINYTLTEFDDESKQRISRLLARATATLVANPERRGLANWAARLLPRLPPEIRQLDSARVLAAAAYVRLANFVPEWSAEAGEDLSQSFAGILPPDFKEQIVRVRFISNGLKLSSLPASGDHTIQVPATEPLLVEVSWETDGHKEAARVELLAAESRIVETRAAEVQIRTLAGRRYRLAQIRNVQEERKSQMSAKRLKCFVLMGFGSKIDYRTGRRLDLDKSYQLIIKPAVEEAGYECRRADEIMHAGNINVPMFREILESDIVIADISTYDPNAFYELGVRHALSPYNTVLIAESELIFPFDVGGLRVHKYRHLGDGFDFAEVQRMRDELKNVLRAMATSPETDSPVYTNLPGLRPPEWEGGDQFPNEQSSQARPEGNTIAALRDQAEASIAKSDFATAKAFLTSLRALAPSENWVVQRLALATYQAKHPTPEAALQEAIGILNALSPRTSTDTETLALWAAIHKRLWDLKFDPSSLDTAIWAYQKTFWLKEDYFSGINLAYLLDVRATQASFEQGIADAVVAQRTRLQVIEICNAALPNATRNEDRYWVLATIAEANVGLGREPQAVKLLDEAKTLADDAAWMVESTGEQLKRLRDLLKLSPLRKLPPQTGPTLAAGAR